MVIIRRLARGVAILAVALAAGHLVQTLNSEQQVNRDTPDDSQEHACCGLSGSAAARRD
jgi:hypothetical protein